LVICAAKNAPINSGFLLPPADADADVLEHWLGLLGGGAVLRDPDFMAYFLTLLRSDLAIHQDYYGEMSREYRQQTLHAIPLLYYGGEEDRFSTECQEEWRTGVADPQHFRIKWWPGGHFFMNSQLPLFVADIFQQIGTAAQSP
jgi:surfactin synthase thioesterase subunit